MLVVLVDLYPRLQIVVTMNAIYTQINSHTLKPYPNASSLGRYSGLKINSSMYHIQDLKKENPNYRGSQRSCDASEQVMVSKIG
jgi:hypothetical protein